MIQIQQIEEFFPKHLQGKAQFYPQMLKEYLHYAILDLLFNSEWGRKLIFIGGTNLRIIHDIDRFSEDLDFDIFDLSREQFMEMTDYVIQKLKKTGIETTADDKDKDQKLQAFRRNLIFPGLLQTQGLSNHPDQKFLIKIEAQPHGIKYTADKPIIQKFNVFTQIQVAPKDVMLSMKLAAMLDRKKGRDYYDCIFLFGKTKPNWKYLSEKLGIGDWPTLKARILESVKEVNFDHKVRDFEHMVFDKEAVKKVGLFTQYIDQLTMHNDR